VHPPSEMVRPVYLEWNTLETMVFKVEIRFFRQFTQVFLQPQFQYATYYFRANLNEKHYLTGLWNAE